MTPYITAQLMFSNYDLRFRISWSSYNSVLWSIISFITHTLFSYIMVYVFIYYGLWFRILWSNLCFRIMVYGLYIMVYNFVYHGLIYDSAPRPMTSYIIYGL